MSQPVSEQYLRGRFRAEYRGEQQPESGRVGGTDYALEITRGAELVDARPAPAYTVTSLLDDKTFQAAVVPSARISYATSATPARVGTLLNLVVKDVQLREVVCHGNTVYGVLEGEAYATLGGGATAGLPMLNAEVHPPAPARGLWRLGCLLPLLTLGVGGCLVSQGIWGGGGSAWLPGGGQVLSEELNPKLDTPDTDTPNLDSLAKTGNDSTATFTKHHPQPEIPVTGPLLSVALSDWSRADGDQVQVLLNGQPVGKPVALQLAPQSMLLRLPATDSVNSLTVQTRSQGTLGVASARLELNDGTHPSQRFDLRGQLGQSFTLRLRPVPAGASSLSNSPLPAATLATTAP